MGHQEAMEQQEVHSTLLVEEVEVESVEEQEGTEGVQEVAEQQDTDTVREAVETMVPISRILHLGG